MSHPLRHGSIGGESSRIGAHVEYDLGYGHVVSEVMGIDEEKHALTFKTLGLPYPHPCGLDSEVTHFLHMFPHCF